MKQIASWLQNDANLTHEQEARLKVPAKYNTTTPTAFSPPTFVYRPPPRVPIVRTLSDIIHDQNITFRIHALFVWLLRSTNMLISENLFDAMPTEEETTKNERKGKNILINSKTTTATVIIKSK